MSRLTKIKEKLEGSLFETSKYGKLKVLKYNNAKDVDILFLNTGYTTNVQMDNIYRNKVKDRLHPTVCGIGVVGVELTRLDHDSILEFLKSEDVKTTQYEFGFKE